MTDRYRIPPYLMARATGLRLQGRVHSPKDRVGEVVSVPGEEDFVIFRQVFLDPVGDVTPEPGANFKVCFQFKRFSARANRILSLIPIPFIVAQPGFRSKTWMLGAETGMFQGFYEWDTIEDAERYWTSFPLELMKRRAAPGSLTHTITRADGVL